MGDAGDVLLQLRDVTQDYGGLRPLRANPDWQLRWNMACETSV